MACSHEDSGLSSVLRRLCFLTCGLQRKAMTIIYFKRQKFCMHLTSDWLHSTNSLEQWRSQHRGTWCCQTWLHLLAMPLPGYQQWVSFIVAKPQLGSSGGTVVKYLPATVGDTGVIPWRSKWQDTPLFLPEKSHGQRSPVGHRPRGRRESDMTEWLSKPQLFHW